MKKYKLLACGGTFDLLHSGHKKFLKDAIDLSDKIILGITSDSYILNYKNKNIESYNKRKSEVQKFLNSIGVEKSVKIIPINTPFEPLLDNKFNPDVLMITTNTKNGASIINKIRKDSGLSGLRIIEVEMLKAEDGEFISSTRIRNGEINRNGMVYVKKEFKKRTFILPEFLRPILQKPLGKKLKSVPLNLEGSKIITIGDITTNKFNEKNVNQKLSVIDFQVQRKNKFNNVSELGFEKDTEVLILKNDPGTIHGDLFEKIKNELNNLKRRIILIEGEEDLVVLPSILVAPLGYRIYYGQPNVGLIEVQVTEKNKEKVFELINKFE